MITLANRIYVTQEYAEAFEQRFRERAGLVDQMPVYFKPRLCSSVTVLRRCKWTKLENLVGPPLWYKLVSNQQ